MWIFDQTHKHDSTVEAVDHGSAEVSKVCTPYCAPAQLLLLLQAQLMQVLQKCYPGVSLLRYRTHSMVITCLLGFAVPC